MPYPNGTIVHSTPVQLKKHELATVERMYSPEVITDTVVEQITYISDGLRINGYLARPAAQGRYPLLIWNRGGSGDRGALNDLTAYLILASTAIWGYVVLATHYRGNRGSEGVEDWGGKDVNDSYNLLETAKFIPGCDMDRVAIEGASRGGMTTYRVLQRDDRFKCALVHAGLTDIFSLCQQQESFSAYVKQLLALYAKADREAELTKRSAILHVDKLPKTTPILLMHGDSDKIVPLEQSEAMAAKLAEYGIPHELHVIPGGGHVALKDGTYKPIDGLRKSWLEKYLFEVK
jgi:dipeptidyl aminopeptidase/acylaminoacyl peptidase